MILDGGMNAAVVDCRVNRDGGMILDISLSLLVALLVVLLVVLLLPSESSLHDVPWL